MARYVVLSFENDNDANTFVDDWEDALKSIQERGEESLPRLLTPVQENDVPVNIVAMTLKPSKFCDPSDGHKGKKTEGGWAKGKKWGLWICLRCGKPSLRWGSSYKAVLGSAKNLLDEEAPDPKKLTPQESSAVARGEYIGANPPPSA